MWATAWSRTAGALAVIGLGLAVQAPTTQATGIPITVSRTVPSELNPPFNVDDGTGGAPAATPAQAAAFAWQEFIALNWPAGQQQGKVGQRDTASLSCKFGDPNCTGPTVWQTFRSKVEIFPGVGLPPGYPGPKGDQTFGYDALPDYNYDSDGAGVRFEPSGRSSTLDQPRRDRPDHSRQYVCRARAVEQFTGQ